MDNIALLLGGIQIYWHGVFMALAIAIAIAVSFVMCARCKIGRKNDLMNCILLSIPVGFILSRVFYWSCNAEEYRTLADHLNFERGGYALYGAIFGVILTAVILRFLSPGFQAGAILDCMAAGGALGIVVGRLASYFSGDNVGIVLKNAKHHFYPLTIYSEKRGEWLLATFNLEAFFGLIIFVALIVLFVNNSSEKKGMKGRHGDIALLFMLMHGCSQGIFDSMHVDALYIMSNSFVRLQQIIGALCFTTVIVIFAIRSFKVNGFRWYQVVSPLMALAAVGITLWMELNRISYHNFIRNYSVIFLCMLGTAVNGVLIYRTTLNKE